uniref:Dihydrolipoamide acetyltransferase component of pyruvate dehydrogenase complex n=1 Tax=Eucampia antarctica TaxID=49252 RepID=A0A7S2RBN8_9STRA|mmetsp:Transcript_20027/g.19282  ORF Transcript_20027/g.19282 Transcript_20027/m.19282 type:complete len:476 (+) Transcript_20027:41-1468(+)
MTLTRCLLLSARQPSRRWLVSKSLTYNISNNCGRCSSVSSGIRSLSSYPPHEVVEMPALSPTMEMGTISSWKVEEGGSFGPGDVLAEIETDKATMDFEAQDEGILARILHPGMEEIPVGTPIGIVVEEESDVSAFANYQVVVAAVAVAEEEVTTIAAPAAVQRQVGVEHVLSPAARHISQSKGLDATGLAGTGKGGRVTKGDLLQALASGVSMPTLSQTPTTTATTTTIPVPVQAAHTAVAAAVVPVKAVPVEMIMTEGSFEDVPNNNMRKVIAKRLTESKSTVPHFYTTVQIPLDEVLKLRKTFPVKISVNDVIVRAAALALRDVPEVNQSEDNIDVSIAVATPGGLITPIVPNTHTLGLHQISTKITDLATRARENKLKPEEYQGGTFCISNLGMFGITEFSAVINPPQAAILAVGGGIPTIVPSKDQKNKPQLQTLMTARLSADRSVVDEPTASLFLQIFRRYLTNPELLLL